MKMSDLLPELEEEILSKVPMTSLRAVRCTCRKWNALSKDRIVCKARKQFLGFMMMDSKVCSMKFDLQGIRKEGDLVDPTIKQIGRLDEVEVSKVFQCDGLLLCVIKDNSRLLVWNPYLGQTRWIQPRNIFVKLDRYALGYDSNSNRNHKILRFLDDYLADGSDLFGFEIYDFCSNSWRVLDVTPDWDIEYHHRGVSLKGNTYFLAQGKVTVDNVLITDFAFLLCFDFTTESFGPRLPLPVHSYHFETVTLSCVRDEQLAVLHQGAQASKMLEIWVTTNIEPTAVSWSKFLAVDMRPLTGFKFREDAGSFFIDEENKAAVVFDLDSGYYNWSMTTCYQTAYIIGQDGYFKSVRLGEAPDVGKPDKVYNFYEYCLPLVCSSYAPSLVQVQINEREEIDLVTFTHHLSLLSFS